MRIEYMKGSNVVSISPIRTQINFPSIGTVEAYWQGLRNGRLMPARGDVDPRGIADVLEYAFVLEKVAPGLARIRLGGMHLNELMAMEVRGMPITAMFLPEARREMQRVIETVMEAPAIVRLTLASDVGLTRRPVEAQMILLPLRDDAGKVTRIVGALQSKGEIGRGPRRFSIRDVETQTLLADAPLPAKPSAPFYPSTAEPRPELTVTTGMSEAPRPFAPKTMELARKLKGDRKAPQETRTAGAHLRLVHDAD